MRRFTALFVGFDVTNLAAVGTLPLSASFLPRGVGGAGRHSTTNAFLFLPCDSTLFVALESIKLTEKSVRALVKTEQLLRQNADLFRALSSNSASPVGLRSLSLPLELVYARYCIWPEPTLSPGQLLRFGVLNTV